MLVILTAFSVGAAWWDRPDGNHGDYCCKKDQYWCHFWNPDASTGCIQPAKCKPSDRKLAGKCVNQPSPTVLGDIGDACCRRQDTDWCDSEPICKEGLSCPVSLQMGCVKNFADIGDACCSRQDTDWCDSEPICKEGLVCPASLQMGCVKKSGKKFADIGEDCCAHKDLDWCKHAPVCVKGAHCAYITDGQYFTCLDNMNDFANYGEPCCEEEDFQCQRGPTCAPPLECNDAMCLSKNTRRLVGSA